MTRVRFDRLFICSMLMAFMLAILHTHAFAAQEEGQYKLSSKVVAAEIGKQLATMGAGDNVKATITGYVSMVLASSNTPLTVNISGLDFNASTRGWSAHMEVESEGELVQQVDLRGRFQRMVSVPVLVRRLQSHEVISKADIAYQDLPENRLRADTIHDASALLGMSPRRVISNQRPIRTHEVQRPSVVERGGLLQVHFRSNGLHISTVAEAREEGAVGDVIRVQNIDSHTVMQAKILSDGNAEVVQFSQLSAKR